MATTKRELSQKTNSAGKSEIIIRLSVGRGMQPRLKTGLFIAPGRFKNGAIIKPRANQVEAAELRTLETTLASLEQFLLNLCTQYPKEKLTREFLSEEVDRYNHPDKYKVSYDDAPRSFFEVTEEFLTSRVLSDWRVKNYRVLFRALARFEGYQRLTGYRSYTIQLETFGADDINAFEAFLREEHALYEKYPDLYAKFPADTRKVRKSRRPLPKGDNTICCTFKRFRAFFNWCNEQGLTDNKPFAKYTGVSSERYGTPYYITTEERDFIARYDLSSRPALAEQRDIFIFHCLIGCRVSDLLRLTPTNIIGGAVEYIANKTKSDRPEVIRVPLHPQAANLVDRYALHSKGRLFPFISPQRYNDAIKEIFTACGITRAVTVLNPTTGREEQRPINEIASSHIARRTFIGNLYKKVKDPNLVGKLSGHKEGSRAFARYRDIDDDMKKELINML